MTGDDEVSVEGQESSSVPSPTEAVDNKEKASAAAALLDTSSTMPWYAVNTYSGMESRAKQNLEERIRTNNIDHKFGAILVPEEPVVELGRGGKKKVSTRKFLPGYMLVQMILDEETWHIVKDTPKITGFVGDSRNPYPLSPADLAALATQIDGGGKKPRPSANFEQGDAVKVIDGPFVEFNGTVDEVRADKGKLRVLISIFGRNTPVELDFVQVEKV